MIQILNSGLVVAQDMPSSSIDPLPWNLPLTMSVSNEMDGITYWCRFPDPFREKEIIQLFRYATWFFSYVRHSSTVMTDFLFFYCFIYLHFYNT